MTTDEYEGAFHGIDLPNKLELASGVTVSVSGHLLTAPYTSCILPAATSILDFLECGPRSLISTSTD